MSNLQEKKEDYILSLDNSGQLTKMDIIEQNLNAIDFGYELCKREYEEKLRWIPVEEKVPEIKKDTYQVLIERQDGMLDLIFIHKTMLDYEVKEILIDWHKAVRWRYIFL